jgi:hypothetical protein
MVSQDLYPLLRAFALRTKSATIDLHQFQTSLSKGQAQPAEVEAAAVELAGKSVVQVSMEDGKPRIVTLPDYPEIALVEEYKQLTIEPHRPFPRHDRAPAPLVESTLINADVKAQLGALLETSGPGMKGIVRLQFPEGVDELVVPRVSIGNDLIDAAVGKIGRYLQDGKNGAYAESKLASTMRGSELLVHSSIDDVTLRPKKAAAGVLTPTDFGFRFWTQLSNLVLQDLRAKNEKTDQDQGVCQSAYIIGYAVFHKKGAVQREKEWADDRKSLEAQVRKPPFVFGFQDLYNLKDDKGATFVAKHSRDFIHSFLKEKTTRSGEESLPAIVRVHAPVQKKEYFIQRDLVVPVYLKKLAETSEDLHRLYLDEWTAELRLDRMPPVAKSDAAFRRDVEIRVKQGYPLLTAMSNGGMLYLAGEETNVSESARAELKKCFAVESILRPFDEILGLSRVELLKNARMYLPFWLTMPILSSILRLFRRMGAGRARAEEAELPAVALAAKKVAGEPPRGAPAAAGAVGAAGQQGTTQKAALDKENLLRYRRTISSLMAQYVPKGGTIDGTLAELAEKWNPLYDKAQKKNLVEDVNALVRDFLRPVRRSFLVRPPDLKRVHALAEQLSASKSLAQIKKRDVLMRYIELYMIRCLQVKSI